MKVWKRSGNTWKKWIFVSWKRTVAPFVLKHGFSLLGKFPVKIFMTVKIMATRYRVFRESWKLNCSGRDNGFPMRGRVLDPPRLNEPCVMYIYIPPPPPFSFPFSLFSSSHHLVYIASDWGDRTGRPRWLLVLSLSCPVPGLGHVT